MVYSGEKLGVMGEALSHKAQHKEKKEGKAIIQYQFQVKNIQLHLVILKNQEFWSLQMTVMTFSPLCDPVAHWAN